MESLCEKKKVRQQQQKKSKTFPTLPPSCHWNARHLLLQLKSHLEFQGDVAKCFLLMYLYIRSGGGGSIAVSSMCPCDTSFILLFSYSSDPHDHYMEPLHFP